MYDWIFPPAYKSVTQAMDNDIPWITLYASMNLVLLLAHIVFFFRALMIAPPEESVEAITPPVMKAAAFLLSGTVLYGSNLLGMFVPVWRLKTLLEIPLFILTAVLLIVVSRKDAIARRKQTAELVKALKDKYTTD